MRTTWGGGGMCFVVVFSIRLYLISSLTIHISLSLLSFFLSFHFITHINSYHHSIYSKDFPRPPPAGSSSSADLMLVPPPSGVGGAGVDDDCVAGVND